MRFWSKYITTVRPMTPPTRTNMPKVKKCLGIELYKTVLASKTTNRAPMRMGTIYKKSSTGRALTDCFIVNVVIFVSVVVPKLYYLFGLGSMSSVVGYAQVYCWKYSHGIYHKQKEKPVLLVTPR